MNEEYIQFNKPFMSGKELYYVAQAHINSQLSGDGPFTKYCNTWLEENLAVKKALLMHSCTAALEVSAYLANISVGDEVIMPSYTFVSTANAFVMRGAIPVFVDIREDTKNINEKLIESAITKKTKAIVVVHYAGVSCEMESINSIASKYNLMVVEDAAQAIFSKYQGKLLGSIGSLGCLSFHETKNVICGEGGALLINDAELNARAEVIREKGTDRSRFFRGEVDKYTWQDQGSSYLPGEIISAFLKAQLENAKYITKERLSIWSNYDEMFSESEGLGLYKKPVVPHECIHNGHMYYLILSPKIDRSKFIIQLKRENIGVVSHYVPLHSSPGGKKYSRTASDMTVTSEVSRQIVRLPLWIGISRSQQSKVYEVTMNKLLKMHKQVESKV